MRALSLFIVLALSSAPGAAQEASRVPIDTLQDIGPALGACWRPPVVSGIYEVTVRLSFKRSGEVLGQPRITFSRFSGDLDEQTSIVGSILDALRECTPLVLTPALGGAIAGRPFTMTFTSPRIGI